eukprot:1439126-Alexandrium_andersonii.AAC.1
MVASTGWLSKLPWNEMPSSPCIGRLNLDAAMRVARSDRLRPTPVSFHCYRRQTNSHHPHHQIIQNIVMFSASPSRVLGAQSEHVSDSTSSSP